MVVREGAAIAISIIIPVYNVERYLDECLESVCRQYEDWMQIICIDDCSEDSSLDILYKWKKRVPAIEIYENSENRGLSYTRNVGIAHARGQYVMFVDSDDYIGNQALKLLSEEATQSNVDVLTFSVGMFADMGYAGELDKNLRIRSAPYRCSKGVSMIAEMVQRNEMFGAVWAAIYRLEYLVQRKIRFIPGIMHEDIPFFFKAMLEADKARGITETCYYYRQRSSSILHIKDYNKALEGMFIGYIDMVNNWFKYNVEHSLESEIENGVNQYLEGVLSVIKKKFFYAYYFGVDKLNPAVSQLAKNFLIKNKESYWFPPNVLRNEKIAIYGAGKRAKDVISLLQRYGATIEKIFVTEKKGNPESIMGIAVYEFAKGAMKEDSILIIAVKDDAEIVRLLEANGIFRYLRYETRMKPEFLIGGLYENNCSSTNEA